MTIKLADSSLLKTDAYIDGQWVKSDSGKTFAVTNPATGQALAEIAQCGSGETRRMIEAAAVAQKLGQKLQPNSALLYCAVGMN